MDTENSTIRACEVEEVQDPSKEDINKTSRENGFGDGGGRHEVVDVGIRHEPVAYNYAHKQVPSEPSPKPFSSDVLYLSHDAFNKI